MKNHFFIPYHGNKRKEVLEIYEVIKDVKFKTLVEPYCGSSAISYYYWTQNKEKDIKYILNDNDKLLTELYTISKDEEKLNNIYLSLLETYDKIKTKEDYIEVAVKAKTDLVSYIYIHKIYAIRPGMYPSKKDIKKDRLKTFINAPIIEFLRNANIEITNNDGLEVYKQYKSDKDALLILDPPYFQALNSWYSSPTTIIYEYLHKNDITDEPATVILVLENTWIIEMLFIKCKQTKYDKKYKNPTHRKTEHTIITNKKHT